MKRFTIPALALLGMFIGSASAGYQATEYVTLGTSYAAGVLGSVRNSASATEYIGCWVHYDASIKSNWANCYARDAKGNYGGCGTSQPELIQLALAIHADSYLRFNWDTTTHNCTDITIDSGSWTEPK